MQVSVNAGKCQRILDMEFGSSNTFINGHKDIQGQC